MEISCPFASNILGVVYFLSMASELGTMGLKSFLFLLCPPIGGN